MEKYYGVYRLHIPTNGIIFFKASEDWLDSKEQRNVINISKFPLLKHEEEWSLDSLMRKYPPPSPEEIEKCYGMKKDSPSPEEKPKEEETKTE